MTLLDALRDEILFIISRRGISKADLARRAGVSRQGLTDWLNGRRRNVTFGYVEKVLKAASNKERKKSA